MKIGIILTPDIRSKAYLSKIINNKIHLDEILFLNDNRVEKKYEQEVVNEAIHSGFDISKSTKEILSDHQISFKEFNFVDINNPILIDWIKKSLINYFIFTGGGILKTEILTAGPKFIHFHPGIVPNYRGSTCFYYSILNEGNCGVTCFIMDKKLDTGDIIFQKIYSVPNHKFIDQVYDSHIRSESLIYILKNKIIEKGNFKKQDPNVGETYFVIHPVLKHIAILSCLK